jgi:lipopolysaccharide export system permease protein
MRKIDKLILRAFIGPLILTFLVVVFILLTRHMLYYFDDIIGKDLGLEVLMQFLGHFAVLMIPSAMPLAILLASLITFGNLAEHFELTAIKSTGISLVRVLRPIFFLVLALTAVALYANNYLVPNSALQAYSLLYDIKHKKPALDIREGVFYDGLPGISIKVNKKFSEDAAALKDIVLYDHQADERVEVTIADSGRMSTIMNERYLKVELFTGYQYSELSPDDQALRKEHEPLSRRKFSKIEMVYDLSSFDIKHTDTKYFAADYRMRNMEELADDIDSMKNLILRQRYAHLGQSGSFDLFMITDPVAFPAGVQSLQTDSLFTARPTLKVVQAATNRARDVKSRLQDANTLMTDYQTGLSVFRLQQQKIPATAGACLVMFLIGAPLGALIKRGGLGMPFLVSIFFFIVYTLLGMHGEDLAREGILPVTPGAWGANIILMITGFIFLRLARNDGRLFEADFYHSLLTTIARRLSGLKLKV